MRFLFSLFEYESSCHVSTAQKSEIFIISTFPAGRAGRSVPCPVRVKFRSVKGILNSFRQVAYTRDRRNPVSPFPSPPIPYHGRYFRLREHKRRSRFPARRAPLRNLTFFTSSSARIDISRKRPA